MMRGFLTGIALFGLLSLEGAAEWDADLRGIAERRGYGAANFRFEQMPGEGEQARIAGEGGQVVIRATCRSAAAFALGRYVREVAGGHVSWCGSRTPANCPVPERELVCASAVPVRMAYNFCTLSYTMAYWTAADWREEIDRLALQGFNGALVLNGLMKVWQLTLRDMGYSEERIEAYLADESALAWWCMGNLEGLGGPVTAQRIEEDARLGRWIYHEMKKAGVEPMLQGFVGLVPSGTAGARSQGVWCGVFTRPALLDPTSERFMRFAERWYENLKAVYGLDARTAPKYLAGDLFHEGGSRTGLSDEDLARATRRIQDLQKRHFGEDVVWVLQSWQGTPPQGVRDGLSPRNTLIELLDPDMSRTGRVEADFFSRPQGEKLPWIWAEVLNFGGNTGLYGGLERMRTLARIGAGDPSFRGYGMLSEGLGTNPLMYDLLVEAFGSTGSASDDLERYARRRYGRWDAHLKTALETFARTAWACPRRQEGCVENVICALPAVGIRAVSQWGPRNGLYYDRNELAKGAREFLVAGEAHPELWAEETYRFDFIDVFLQVLADRARELNAKLATDGSARAGFRRLIALSEKLARGDGRWMFRPRRAGYARLLTTWTRGFAASRTSGLMDYAHRAWAGLIGSYYGVRWGWYLDLLEGRLTQGEYESRVERLGDAVETLELDEAVETRSPEEFLRLGREILREVDCGIICA